VKALVLPNMTNPSAPQCAEDTARMLKRVGIEVLTADSSSADFASLLEKNVQICDIIIVIGGDGTILYFLPLAVKYNKPILGINTGMAGFICSIEPEELPILSRLAEGDYQEEERMLLEVSLVSPDAERRNTYLALNDAVICNNKGAYVASLSVDCDGNPVGDYLGDGLIIATPTGSTAYNLSAGGTVCDPTLSLIAMTPICPHSLLQRPLIFSPHAVLEVKRSTLKRSGEIVLVVDGGEGIVLREEESVRIAKASKTVRFIRFGHKAFFDNLRAKLSH